MGSRARDTMSCRHSAEAVAVATPELVLSWCIADRPVLHEVDINQTECVELHPVE